MSLDPSSPPNPTNSAIEKLLVQRQQLWTPDAMARYLQQEGLDPNLAGPIGRAFGRLGEESTFQFQQLLLELQTWANIHTHPGVSGSTAGTEFGTGFVALFMDSGAANSVFTLGVDESAWTEWPSAIPGYANTVGYGSAKMVAVGVDGNDVLNSADPFTSWSTVASLGFRVTRVAWNGTKFLAVGAGGRIAESTDGVTWNSADGALVAPLAGTSTLNDVCWDGTYWYVGGSGEIYRALDADTATSWTRVATSLGVTVFGIKYNGTRLLAWGQSLNELKTFYTTDNGATWTATAAYPTGTEPGVGTRGYTGAGPTGFVVSGDATSATAGPIFIDDPSTASHAQCVKADGVTRLANSPAAFGNPLWDGVRWRMLGPMDDGSTGSWQMWVSTDGIVWSPHSSFVSAKNQVLLAYDAVEYPLTA